MTRTGFCMHPSPGSHVYCHEHGPTCSCECHADIASFDDGMRIGDKPVAEPLEDDVENLAPVTPS